MPRPIGVFLLLVLTTSLFAGLGQEETSVPSDAPYKFVSGTISELPPGKIVVNRAVLGKTPENRTFTITSDTKVEGKLRMKARVTVGFRETDDGEPVAMRIIVRPQNQKSKP
jgi:hypothetical protein